MKMNKIIVAALLGLTLTACTKDPDPNEITTPTSAISGVFVNEVAPKGAPGDWIEIYNSNSTEVDLTGCKLFDGNGIAEAYIISGKIAANQYLVFEKETHFAFGLNESDEVTLTDGNNSVISKTALDGQRDEEGISWSRKADGTYEWKVETKGIANHLTPDTPSTESEYIGKLFLNEVDADGQPEDWVELYNGSNAPISLEGFQLLDAKGVSEGKDIYTFAATTILSGEFLLLEGETTFLFGIGKSDETLTLIDAEGKEVDFIAMPDHEDGKTYGRTTDGENNWAYGNATPGASNNTK